MTSWNRGRENEEIGEQQLNDGDPGNNLEGAARKVGGEIEQGLDNLGDTLTGKQDDLKGKDQNWDARAGDAVDDATDKAGDWVQNRGEDIKDATR